MNARVFPFLLLWSVAWACVRADSLSVRHYTMSDGLSGPNVRRIVELPPGSGFGSSTGCGALVAQEENGISLFDGERFRPLPYDRRKTLPVESFFGTDCTLDTLHGRLWLRDFHTLSVYDTRTLSQLDARALLPDSVAPGQAVRNVFIDAEGDGWLLAANDSLYFCEAGGGRAPRPVMAVGAGAGVSCTVCDVVQMGSRCYVLISDGQLVCLTRVQGAFREAYRQGVCDPLRAYTLTGAVWDEHTLLLTTSAEVLWYDTRTRRAASLPCALRVNDVKRVPPGSDLSSLWGGSGEGFVVATNAGLLCYDGSRRLRASYDTFVPAPHGPAGDGPASSYVVHLCFDHEGGLWSCTPSDGVRYHSPSAPFLQFVPLRSPEGRPLEVRSLAATPDGALAATTAGVYRLPAEGAPVRLGSLPDCLFTDISRDWDGHYWLATSQGWLYELDARGELLGSFSEREVALLTGAIPFCLPVDGDCYLTCTRFNRLGLFFPRERRLDVLSEAYPGLSRFRYIIDACPGTLRQGSSSDSLRQVEGYFIASQNGLFFFDAQARAPLFDPLPAFTHNPSSDKCTSLLRTSDGLVWIGTQRGLFRYDAQSDSLTHLTTSSGLPDDCVLSLVEGDGALWVGTATGVLRLGGSGDTFVLREADVLRGAPFSEHSACHVSGGPVSMVLFGARGGVYTVDCAALSAFRARADAALQPVVTSVRVGDSLLVPQGEVLLRHDEHSVRFQVSALAYSLDRHVLYRFRLRPATRHGASVAWEERPGGGGNIGVDYRLLAPGRYVFEVEASLQGQSWGPSAVLGVRVLPPWWRSWWAWLGYGLLLVGLLLWVALMVLRRRERRLDYARRLRTQRDREQLGEERMRFYTNITHELRTPLTLILGPMEDLCEEPTLSAAVQERMRRVSASAHRLLQLVNRLLEFRKVETGNRPLDLRPLDLSVHCREQFRHFAYQNRNAHLEFIEDIAPGVPMVLFDADALTSIVSNLLSNAVKFTPSGSVRLSLRQEGGALVLQVSDTGIGIPADVLPRLFRPYYQAPGSDPRGGTGIGLALVRSLVESLGGKVGVESELGRGSTFTLTFDKLESRQPPVAPPMVGEPQPLEPCGSTQAPCGLALDSLPSGGEVGGLVLVVEDNADILGYASEALSGGGFTCLCASDGREGAELALAEVPDLVVTDVMMPGLDGLQLCRLLRQDVRTSHIPIVMLTAKDTLGDKEAGYEAGADAYLTKPFTTKMLRALASNILTTRRRQAQRLMAAQGAVAGVPGSPREAGSPARQPEEAGGSRPLSTLDRRFIDDLNRLVDENLNNAALDMPFLCDRLFMSRTTLYRKVKALLGVSPNEYIRSRRLHRAHAMLTDPRFAHCTVTSIAYDCGFSTLGYFRNCFKAEFGVVPSAIER